MSSFFNLNLESLQFRANYIQVKNDKKQNVSLIHISGSVDCNRHGTYRIFSSVTKRN